MKSIELTKDHKSKLLEMCKVLFPEYEFDYEPELYGRGIGQNIDCLSIYGKNVYENIHWFEFCMTHLCVKIYNLIDKYNNDLFINMFHGSILSFTHFKESGDFVAIHPVDYLYEEFKKLK
jgi:hypothetical protein